MTSAAESAVRFNILGSLEGWVGGSRIRLGGAIQERVLVTLLLDAGKVLPVSRLVEAAWAEDPPPTAAHQVRKAVADLRRRLPEGAGILLTDGPGYRAVVDTAQLDLAEFSELLAGSRTAVAAGRKPEAADMLTRALELWRGPVMSGEGGSVIESAAAALEERRLGAAEQLFGFRLEFGESDELVSPLRELTDRYPLRETLRAQLMLALYRSGRQAEALEEYSRVRDLLVEELGVDPGRRLTEVYEGILRESPEVAGAPAAPAAPSWSEIPNTLPPDLSDFTGRERELVEVVRIGLAAGGRGRRIVAIDGMGGCGKTTLAVRAAHRIAEAYPDGQLYLDLHGYTPGRQPLTAGAALDTLLRTLGVSGERIPDDGVGRTSLWRASLAGKRILLLLDNAADVAALGPLLPTAPGCTVMITSRARLLDLDGAEWISLGVMAPEESAGLVAETLGADRVAAEPEAAAELAHLCGHLPLALRIATARLSNRPHWTLQYLADRLRDETRRLDELSSGARSVAATLRLSYQALDEDCRAAFRILALHPGGATDLHAAGALLGTDTRQAENLLETLLDVHLVQQTEVDYYTFHDLVRSFAQTLLGESPDGEEAQAVERLLGYFLAATEVACETLFPGRRIRPTGLPDSAAELPALRDPDLAQSWFVREQTALMTMIRNAEKDGYDRYVTCLARNVVFQLHARGQLHEFAEVGRIAVAAARRLGDLGLLGVSLSNLGVACWNLGRFAEGIEVAKEGREVAAQLGDQHTVAHSESTLGQFSSLLGRFAEAEEYLRRAMAHQRDLGASRAEAESFTILSTLYEQWGRYEEAAETARRAVELSDRLGRREIQLMALTDLAFAHVGLEQYEEADRRLERARALCDEARDPGHVAMALALSAYVDHLLGRAAGPEADAAFDNMAAALHLVRSAVSPLRRAKVENIAGRLRHRMGDDVSALALHTNAHMCASAIDYRVEDAYALAGMGAAAEALGDTEAAARHRAAAERLFAGLDVPLDRRRR